jgi:uncharacterized protein YbaP (TraB family)
VVKDADTTIYLFGTVHVLKPGLSWFDDAVKAAFDKSDDRGARNDRARHCRRCRA